MSEPERFATRRAMIGYKANTGYRSYDDWSCSYWKLCWGLTRASAERRARRYVARFERQIARLNTWEPARAAAGEGNDDG